MSEALWGHGDVTESNGSSNIIIGKNDGLKYMIVLDFAEFISHETLLVLIHNFVRKSILKASR